MFISVYKNNMDLQQEQLLKDKQDFLSKEILEEGFDPEDFQDFMLAESDKDLDLREWSLEELKDVVNKYKKPKEEKEKIEEEKLEESKEDKKFEKKQEIKFEEPKQMPPIKQTEADKPNKQKSEKQKKHKKIENMQLEPGTNKRTSHAHTHIDLEMYQIKKKVNVSELYVLSTMQKKNIVIKIKKYTKTNPDDLFKASYIQYQIQTSEGWKVSRRYNDFIWLREYFEKIYYGIPVPPIPEKTAVRSFDQKHIQFRMKALQRCLNAMLKIPQICSDQTFQIFLRADKEYFSQIKRQKERQQNQQSNSYVLQSILGPDLLVQGKDGVSERRQHQYNELGFKYQLLCSQLSNFQETLKKASAQSYLISSTFQEIHARLKSPKGLGIFSVMYTFFNQLGIHLSKTTEQFKDSIFAVWNYETANISSLNETLSKLSKDHHNILSKQKSLLPHLSEGKPKVQTADTPKWTKQLKELQASKQKYKIRLSYLLRGLKQYEKNNFKIISEEWTKSLRMYIGEISEWMIGCTDQLTRSMSLAQGKQLMEVQYLKT